ncbi:MAG: hypothetical protein ACK5JS_05550 [Mangrovibacterium sp.]
MGLNAEEICLACKRGFLGRGWKPSCKTRGQFTEMGGWNAKSDAAMLLSGLGVKEDLHYTQMADREA